MPSVNHCVLVGRLTRDPERNGPALKFGLAVSRFGKDAGADFIDCVVFDHLADNMEKMLSKGILIMVEGRLKHSTWQNEGGKRSKVEVVSFNVQILDRPKQGGEAESESAEDAPPEGADDGDSWN